MKYLAFSVVLVAFYACGTSNAGDAGTEAIARLSHVEPAVTGVGVAIARRGDFNIELMSNGRLEATRGAVVPFAVQEQVLMVAVQEGQRVTAGQLLGKVEPFSYQKRLDDAVDSYEQAIIDFEDRLLAHGYSLADTALVPPNILKMVRVRSGYNHALSQLARARRELAQTAITAPISGVVANLEAREHNHSSTFRYFCRVLDISSMNLVFHLLETEASQAKEGQSVEVVPFALPGETFIGRVTSVNPDVDANGMVRVIATLPNPNHRLVNGMNARVRLRNSVPGSLIIPKEAVLYRQNREVVFVYQGGKAIWKYVETSHQNSAEVVVTDGLEEGMQVIVENNLHLAHESPVTISSSR